MKWRRLGSPTPQLNELVPTPVTTPPDGSENTPVVLPVKVVTGPALTLSTATKAIQKSEPRNTARHTVMQGLLAIWPLVGLDMDAIPPIAGVKISVCGRAAFTAPAAFAPRQGRS